MPFMQTNNWPKQPVVKSSIQNYVHKLSKMFTPTLLDFLLMALMIIAAAFSFVLTVFLVDVSIPFNFLMFIIILVIDQTIKSQNNRQPNPPTVPVP